MNEILRIILLILAVLAFLWLLFKFLFDWEKDELVRTKRTLDNSSSTNTASTASTARTAAPVAVASAATRPSAPRPRPATKPTPWPVAKAPARTASTASSNRATKPVAKKAAPKATASKKDDLTKVEGIGPKINQLLNKANIYSFSDLSGANKADLKEILENAGSRFQMHDPSTWAEQAGFAAKGDWKGLESLQNRLDGGKR